MKRRTFVATSISSLAIAGCGTEDSPEELQTSNPGKLVSRDPNYLRKSRRDLGVMRFAGELPYEVYSYQVINDPTLKSPSALVERFELREENCFIPRDCQMDKQRSEIQGTGAYYGLECKYEMSVYVPPNFHPFGTFCHVGLNLHAKNNNGTNNTALIMPLMGGDDKSTRLYAMIFNGKKRERHKVIPYLNMIGRWTKLEVHSKWHESGFHKIYANDELVVDYSGYTLGSSSESPFDLKYGLYRGRVSEFKKRYNMKRYPDQVAYYAAVKMSKL